MSGLDQLLTFPRFGKLGVNERMAVMCEGIDQVPAIKIVGSNGKGTTAHMMADMVQRLGKSVGLYTSPHLLKVNERIKVNGLDIPDADLDDLLYWACARAEMLDDVGRLEILTLAAIQYFAQC